MNEHGAVWRGRRILAPGRGRALRLLQVLAARPGECVPRRELWRQLCPEDHTRGGAVGRGRNTDRFDTRLRILVAELRGGLRDAGLDAAVENQRGDEATGGYRLALPPERGRLG